MKDRATKNGHEWAFPIIHENFTPQFGLTKREHFAALAMQGLLAHSGFGELHADIANNAVMLADELLLQLEKPQK